VNLLSDLTIAALRPTDAFLPPAAQAVLPADHQLQRVIGPWAVAANSINSAVGGGIFVLPGLIAAILGPAALISYAICGLAIALVLTCYAEIGSIVHRSGGGIAYIEEAFGPLAGFLAFVTYALCVTVVACAAIGNLLVDAAATVLPPLAHGAPRIFALLLLFTFLAAINVRGVRHGVRLTIITTVAKLVPLVLLIVVGMFYMHRGNFHWTGAPSMAKLGEGSLLTYFAYQAAERSPWSQRGNPQPKAHRPARHPVCDDRSHPALRAFAGRLPGSSRRRTCP
jgi:amino acid transporter